MNVSGDITLDSTIRHSLGLMNKFSRCLTHIFNGAGVYGNTPVLV